MERVALEVELRETGKGASHRLRAVGLVPAVVYGKKMKAAHVSVKSDDMAKIVKTKSGMNVMIDLTVKGEDSGLAFIRDYQADPFKRKFTHVDFQAISLDEKIEIEIPIEFTGASKGVKEGGVLEILRRTLHVKTLPTKIPEKVSVDITELMIGDSVHADELKLPEGVEFPHAVNYSIVAVVPPAKEEVAAPVAASVEGEAAVAPAEGAAATPAAGAPAGGVPAAGVAAPAGEKKTEKPAKAEKTEKK